MASGHHGSSLSSTWSTCSFTDCFIHSLIWIWQQDTVLSIGYRQVEDKSLLSHNPQSRGERDTLADNPTTWVCWQTYRQHQEQKWAEVMGARSGLQGSLKVMPLQCLNTCLVLASQATCGALMRASLETKAQKAGWEGFSGQARRLQPKGSSPESLVLEGNIQTWFGGGFLKTQFQLIFSSLFVFTEDGKWKECISPFHRRGSSGTGPRQRRFSWGLGGKPQLEV